MSNQYTGATPLADRFWSKVNKQGALWTDPDTGETSHCWEWTGALMSRGYGVIGTEKATSARAHRVSYEIAFGEIPENLFVLHKCDNRRCVNPSHLKLGTHPDNMNDMTERNRAATGERNGVYTHSESRPRGERNGMNTHPESRPRGEKHGQAKLNWEQVNQIRELAKEPKDYARIAHQFGVSESQVRDIVKGRSWKKAS